MAEEIEEVKKKQLDTEDPYKPRGKGKKALHRLIALNEEIEAIEKQMEDAAKKLGEILNNTVETLKYHEVVPKCLEKLGKSKEPEKQRSMVAIAPKRIEFEFNCMKFYIDFTLVASERDGQNNIKGSIIYGTNRTLCFLNCIFPNKGTDDDCKNCERISRCDRLEDKPLISFEVTQHGMIQSSGKLEGEWWIEDKSDLLELHYRTLDLIWKDALDWTNEIILP